MQLAEVKGTATATIKHSSMQGWRLLVVQPLGATGQPDGDPLIAIDDQGSTVGQNVIISSDGAGVREMMGTNNTPVRWFVMGQPDKQTDSRPS